jgi:hypothetical protein
VSPQGGLEAQSRCIQVRSGGFHCTAKGLCS